MPENRLISLHPHLAALLDGLFSLVSIWWLMNAQNTLMVAIWFAVRSVWWAALVYFVYCPPYINRYKHFASLVLCNIGTTAFLVFSDQSNLRISEALAVFMPAASFWLIPSSSKTLSVMEKPHRRWKFFMSLFGVIGIWLTLFALTVFQIFSGQLVIWSVFVASALVTSISVWEWVEYGEKITIKMYSLAAILFLIMLEAGGIVFLWPIGYFVSSFFLTWLWYVTWLLFRFNLSESGIDWAKQRFFLLTNLALMIVFLTFIVRWK